MRLNQKKKLKSRLFIKSAERKEHKQEIKKVGRADFCIKKLFLRRVGFLFFLPKHIFKKAFIIFLIFTWVFSGWLQIFNFLPEVEIARASHTTTFVFSADAESWSYTDDSADCSGAFSSGAGNPSGSLQTTGSKSGGGVTCNAYWEWTGTWEDLGVTSGDIVSGVSGSYEYAVSDDSSNGTWDTGAFELRNSGGTLRETMVTALTGQTGTAGFTQRSGTEQAFTGEASNTTVRLRINTVIAFSGGTRSWTGQNDNIAVTITHSSATISTDIVDASYVSVGSPTMAMNTTTFDFACQTVTGSFGTTSEQIYVNNDNGADNGWTLTLAAQATTSVWDSTGTDYDFNDPTGSGCTDGGDSDSLGGQMTVDPSVATLAVGQCGSCTTNNISKGNSASFNEGTTDTITLLTATSASDNVGDWTLQGVSISQKIPAEQPAASDYSINMVLTVTAS